MDLRQLEYVVAVADTGGFTTGAAAAHVAQPSLSARIRDLEAELGVELFHRVGRGSRLSPAGEVVSDHARQVLRDVAGLRSAAAAVAGLEAGRLEMVALPTLAVDPLAGLLGRFRAAHPRVAVRVDEVDDAAAAVAQVRAGRAEVGLTELGAAAGLVQVPLSDQELYAIGAPSLPIPRRGRLPLAAVAGVPLVLTPPGTSSRRVVEAALAEAGVEPVIAVEVAQREAVVPLALAGAGMGFVPAGQARAARAQGAVVLRPDPPLVRRIGVVHRAGRLSPAAEAFLQVTGRAGTPRPGGHPVSRSGR